MRRYDADVILPQTSLVFHDSREVFSSEFVCNYHPGCYYCRFLCAYLGVRSGVRHVTAKCPAHHAVSGHFSACLTAAGIALVILMRPIRSGSSIWRLLPILLHVLVFGCQVSCSQIKSFGQGEGLWNFPPPTQRSRRPYLRIFSEICLFPQASFFIQFQNVLYLACI